MVGIALATVGKVANGFNPEGLLFKAMGSEIQPIAFHITGLEFAVAALQYINNGTGSYDKRTTDSLGNIKLHIGICRHEELIQHFCLYIFAKVFVANGGRRSSEEAGTGAGLVNLAKPRDDRGQVRVIFLRTELFPYLFLSVTFFNSLYVHAPP